MALNKKKSGKQGFASMSDEEQRAIASKGGKAAHSAGTAHEWTSQEAAAAGRLGGKASHQNRNDRDESEEESY